jgi:alanine racemase
MSPSPNVKVSIDLAKIRENSAEIKRKVGVEVWAVVKADGYGLGITRVADALKDIVDGFCVFRLSEATEMDLKEFGKPILALGPPESSNARPLKLPSSFGWRTTTRVVYGLSAAVPDTKYSVVL